MSDKERKGASSGSLFLSRVDLLNVGCKNCVFSLSGQCWHGLGPGEFLDEGYCQELVDWLFSLSDGSGSSAVVWEGYHLFVARLQNSEDFREYRLLDGEIRRLEALKVLNPKLREELVMKRAAARIFWERVNEMLIRQHSRQVDREVKERVAEKDRSREVLHKISLEQIHQLAGEARKQLEAETRMEDEIDDDE
jgi:hypothetical protein